MVNRHEILDRRSLAFGLAIAKRLRTNPALIERAQRTLQNWMEFCSPGVKPTLDEWATVLAKGADAVIFLLTSNDQDATRLRQSNPFAGVLSQSERNAILRRFEQHESSPT